jgi:endonuclease III
MATPLKAVAERLEGTYGSPGRDGDLPLGNKVDPLDELIFIILTVMTEFGVDGVYRELRKRYPTWEQLMAARVSTIARILQPIGLREQRARRIKSLLREIQRREGKVDLTRLHVMRDDDAEAYLVTLPGVGKKVARCVMLYSLGRDTFPVDSHVLRVLKRLGLAESALTLQSSQDLLQGRIPQVLRYTLHVNLVIHGRTVCKARQPNCAACVLRPPCPAARPIPPTASCGSSDGHSAVVE